MSQGIFNSINPNTTSGTQLAIILDDFKNAVVSGFSGNSRPANLNAYGYWIDTTNQGTGILVYKMYDGTNDITIFTINTNTQSISFPGSDSSFQILRTSDDSVGPSLRLQKKRVTGGGQTKNGDILGDVDFIGNNDSSVTYTQARIRVTALEDVATSSHGASMGFFVTPFEGASLTKVLTLRGNGKIGLGVDDPLSSVHAYGVDSSVGYLSEVVANSVDGAIVGFQKRRLSTNGQVLSGDTIGSFFWYSNNAESDVETRKIEVAKMEVIATQNHTLTNQGVKLVISTKNNDSNTFSEAIKIENGEVTLFGQKQINTKITTDLLNQSVTRQLLTMDGSIYGAFKVELFTTGRNLTDDAYFQNMTIKGVYDYNNTTWKISEDSDSMESDARVINLAIPDKDVENLVINYVNQIASFNDGKIYMTIERYAR